MRIREQIKARCFCDKISESLESVVYFCRKKYLVSIVYDAFVEILCGFCAYFTILEKRKKN